MIPLARRLHEMNNNIIIGSGEEHLTFLKNELPGMTFIHFPGFRMRFSRYLPQYIVVFLKIPLYIFHSVKEHKRLKKIIKAYSIDIVISDSRAGLWNAGIKSVFVLHIPRIPLPGQFKFVEPFGIYLSRLVIRKYTYCYIPDLEGDMNLSGRLSHEINLPDNVRYIGILSRFAEKGLPGKSVHQNNCCTVILSGPEPQRGMMKLKLTEIFNARGRSAVMLEGQPGREPDLSQSGCVSFLSHLPDSEMRNLILESENIITRSGYSTIMELISLNRSALIIPTPGQTEQEYLAEYLSGKGWFRTVAQKDLDARIELHGTAASWPPDLITESAGLLDKALHELLEE